MKKLLFLITLLGTIDLTAQTPPLPAYVKENLTWMATNAPIKALKPKTFVGHCPHCKATSRHLSPVGIISVKNDVISDTNCIVITTRSFLCPACDFTFIAKTKETIPIPMAEEESDLPPMPATSAATNTWTTNPNLRLAIEILNKTNVLVLTGVTNGSVISNTINLGISPFAMVAVRFPTEMGKTYKCQASDDSYTNGDPRKVWFNGPIVAGTGQFVTNYEMPVKMSRLYRVVENPL